MSRLSHVEHYSPGLYGLPHMGEVIAAYRIRKGWTSQEAFAIVCGVEKQTVVYWEKQRYLADMERRIFLCKLLKIPPALLGLTWRSIVDEEHTYTFIDDFEHVTHMLKDNSYGLYEDVLALAHTGPHRYSPSATYRFKKHLQELEMLVPHVPESEKDSWKDLLCRYYQHAAFIALHHKDDTQALSCAHHAVHLASTLETEDAELTGSTLYKRARIHLIQNQHDVARQDIQAALDKAAHARGPLKGNTYLLAAEIHALYSRGDEKLKVQCRKWQDMAANILYKGKIEEDETFLWFSLYSVHHEKAKTFLRFALFHANDTELVERLKEPHTRANTQLLKDAEAALETAKNHLHSVRETGAMDCALTEARLFLVGKEFEESAKAAKNALKIAHLAHSKQGTKQILKVYNILHILAPKNPYVQNLGIELGLY